MMQKQADELQTLIELYFPEHTTIRAIDFTYGTGALWWNYTKKDSIELKPRFCCNTYPLELTKCDRDPAWLHKDETEKRLLNEYYVKKYASKKATKMEESARKQFALAEAQTIVQRKLAQMIDPTVLVKDISKDAYVDLGKHDIALFDPPYLIGRDSFDYSAKVVAGELVPQQYQGARSWGGNGLSKYVANPDIETFNERVRQINVKAPTVLKQNGVLFVKVMNPRFEGRLVEHDRTIRNILADPVTGNFMVEDVGIYVRQGATTFVTKNHLQNLNGFWLIFRKK